MIGPNAALTAHYDPLQAALSILIAISGAYMAIDLTGRVAASPDHARLDWLSGRDPHHGHWHMVNALHRDGRVPLPIPVRYHWPTVVVALLVDISSSAFVLDVASRPKLMTGRVLISSLAMGRRHCRAALQSVGWPEGSPTRLFLLGVTLWNE
jgi:NO-binding membrane sensor protein with MHYT domain